jgi:hypothetical protein
LGDDGWDSGRAFHGHDASRVVGLNSPVLGHVVLDGSRASPEGGRNTSD